MQTQLKNLFDVRYGVNLELINCEKTEKEDSNKIKFISRSSKNNGLAAYVKKMKGIEPNPKWTLSCAATGSVLSTFLQKDEYYSGRDLYVLKPLVEMNEEQMIFYSICIEKNAYKYSYGRGANKTLSFMNVPSISEANKFLEEEGIQISYKNSEIATNFAKNKKNLSDKKSGSFLVGDIFEVKRGNMSKKPQKQDKNTSTLPYVSASGINNGISEFYCLKDVGEQKIEKGNCITVANNGSVGASFYQKKDFLASSDVTIIRNKNIDKYNALFIATLFEKESWKFSYGRKWSTQKMKMLKVNLPVDDVGNVDWNWMSSFVKSYKNSDLI